MKTLKEDFKGTPGEIYPEEYAGYISLQDVKGYVNTIDMLNIESVGENTAWANAKLFCASKKMIEVLEMCHNKIKTEISINAFLQQIPEMDLQQALDDDEILKAIKSVLDEAL